MLIEVESYIVGKGECFILNIIIIAEQLIAKRHILVTTLPDINEWK